jgi:hypothetical protein
MTASSPQPNDRNLIASLTPQQHAISGVVAVSTWSRPQNGCGLYLEPAQYNQESLSALAFNS